MSPLDWQVQRLRDVVDDICNYGTADEAMRAMTFLRDQAKRLDVLLGNPAHQWNRVDG